MIYVLRNSGSLDVFLKYMVLYIVWCSKLKIPK